MIVAHCKPFVARQATRDSFYFDVGERILEDLTRRAKVPCGLSTISNLLTSTREDRMESFALSESLKVMSFCQFPQGAYVDVM